jgi:hypothetical protein
LISTGFLLFPAMPPSLPRKTSSLRPSHVEYFRPSERYWMASGMGGCAAEVGDGDGISGSQIRFNCVTSKVIDPVNTTYGASQSRA